MECKENTEFPCALSKVGELHVFITNIFIDFVSIMVTTLKLKGLTKEVVVSTISQLLLESSDIKEHARFLLKPGVADVEDIVRAIADNQLDYSREKLKLCTLNEMMGAIYGAVIHSGVFHVIFEQCTKGAFIAKHSDAIAGELEVVMHTLRTVFALPDSFNSKQFFEFASKSYKVCEEDDSGNGKCFKINKDGWLKILLDMMVYRDGKARLSIVNRNLNNLEYVRTRVKKGVMEEYKSVTKLTPGHCPRVTRVTSLNTKKEVYLVDGDTWYSPSEDSFYAVVMNSLGRVVKAGPSGSTFMWMNFVFNLLKVPCTPNNKLKLLMCIICDFVPHYHSLNEVLFVYSREDENVIPYTMNENPANWLISHLGININDLDTPQKVVELLQDRLK